MSMFVKKYHELRNKGFDDVEAFGLVAGSIAMAGTIEDLQKVHDVHSEDFFSENVETEEILNEDDQVAESEAS